MYPFGGKPKRFKVCPVVAPVHAAKSGMAMETVDMRDAAMTE